MEKAIDTRKRIALVTNKQLHHKYWVKELYDRNNVVLILHPVGSRRSFKDKLLSKKPLYYGFFHLFLKALSIIYQNCSRKGLARLIVDAEKEYFHRYKASYENIPREMIHEVETINSTFSIELVKKSNVDIVCFLGGDIAGKGIINSVSLCLNYHSGISPFYNGTKTNFHAVSDFRPNFAGGTLMKMNERIDGGEVLMHYLTPINSEDKAEDLFMKGIKGAVKCYQKLLDNYEYNLTGIEQKKSFKYVRNIDWIITNDKRLDKFYQYDRMKLYERSELIIDYINKGYDIGDLYRLSLTEIL